MLSTLFRASSRTVASATLLAMGLLVAGPLGSARADEIPDPVGDFLPTYTGPHDPGLDVLAHEVLLQGDRVIFLGRMAGPIAPTQDIGGLYLFGLDRGRGTPRFLGGTPQIGPNVVWDSVLRINPNGTGAFANQVAGIVTPLNPADISIDGNEFTASVPLSLLLPAATLPPEEWTYNLWPRNGVIIGQNQHVSDLAPDDGNAPVQTGELQAYAGPPQTVECDSADGTVVLLSGLALGVGEGSVSYQWSAPDIVLLADDASASTLGLFPVGITEVTLTVIDEEGDFAVDTVRITVVDTIPPEVACTTDLAALWPPNHQMVEVGVFIEATDACTHPDDLLLLEVVVTSDEPDDAEGNGDGTTTGDTDGEDGFAAAVDVTELFTFNPATARFEGSVFLRAERAGAGSGRTYTIRATVLDSHNNLATSSCVVVVPHDQSP
ncbi:MAG TPA: hypothetical protein VMP01_23165 [Pirellulaceae bacterium]|nr:hypothetical protein [Pirellulaceae bacterium]